MITKHKKTMLLEYYTTDNHILMHQETAFVWYNLNSRKVRNSNIYTKWTRTNLSGTHMTKLGNKISDTYQTKQNRLSYVYNIAQKVKVITQNMN